MRGATRRAPATPESGSGAELPDSFGLVDHRWLVMADPAGNEFCVVQRPAGVDVASRAGEAG